MPFHTLSFPATVTGNVPESSNPATLGKFLGYCIGDLMSCASPRLVRTGNAVDFGLDSGPSRSYREAAAIRQNEGEERGREIKI